MKDTMALIFAYQNDEPMKALTQKRSLSSVPYGGRYRIIDFALSNIVNSGITKVGIITRSHYQSLMDHLGSGKEWDLNRKRDGLFVLPPFSHMEGYQHGVYRGKMEALMNAEALIRRSNHEYVILSTADSVCNMTFNDALEYHKSSEWNLACTDLILILGREQDIDPETLCYDTSKLEAFLVPAGTAFETYATTLHYAPCGVEGAGFRLVVVLPRGTNLPLETVPAREGIDRLLFCRNKWLLAHPEAQIDGAFNGLTGENPTV